MLLAIKGNREHKIDETEKQAFIDSGYKILEVLKDGKFKVVHDPIKATSDGVKLAEENKKLKEKVSELKAKVEELEKVEEPKTKK